jgi:ketosteroid isomerase-like protein
MYRTIAAVAALLLSIAAAADSHAPARAEVAAAVADFNSAYANGEVDAYFAYYAPDASAYFYGARQDLAAYQEEWTALVAAGGAVEKNELSDVEIRMLPGGDVAVATYFVDYRLRMPDGEISASKAFESEVWQRIDGEWKIVNLHYSEIPETD